MRAILGSFFIFYLLSYCSSRLNEKKLDSELGYFIGFEVDGLKEGLWVMIRDNNDTLFTEFYVRDMKVLRTEYLPTNSKIISFYNNNGEESGPRMKLYEDGLIETVVNNSSSGYRGFSTYFDKSGKVITSQNFDAYGKPKIYREYHSNGRLKKESNDMKSGNGIMKAFDKNGKYLYSIKFKNYVPYDTIP